MVTKNISILMGTIVVVSLTFSLAYFHSTKSAADKKTAALKKKELEDKAKGLDPTNDKAMKTFTMITHI